MNYRRRIGSFDVVATCTADLEAPATALLDTLARLNQRGPALRDGTTVAFGWSLLTLKGDGNELVVCEPDFEGDPRHNIVPQVEHTLRVLTEQVALLRFAGSESVDVSYRDQVVIEKHSLGAQRIYLERTSGQSDRDSGWYIGRVEDAEANEDIEVRYVYEVFQSRPALLKALALPPGFLVVFDGDILEAVFNQEGTQVLPRQSSQQ